MRMIFLKPRQRSKPLVLRLTEPLPPHVQVWLDRDALAAGQRFAPRIEAAIRRDCDFVLVFIDEHALASDWVKRETALALQRQADLQRAFALPVLLQPLGERMTELGIDGADALHRCHRHRRRRHRAGHTRLIGDELVNTPA